MCLFSDHCIYASTINSLVLAKGEDFRKTCVNFCCVLNHGSWFDLTLVGLTLWPIRMPMLTKVAAKQCLLHGHIQWIVLPTVRLALR